jgi:phosphoenolpyruvate phosphomutase
MSFMKHWKLDTPVVIVPTQYPSEPIQSFVDAGVTNFIFANQSLRTVVTALQRNLKKLHDTHDLMSIEKEIVPVKEIFRLQNVAELTSAEERYLPSVGEGKRALVLAATKGNFGKLVEERPKCMLRLSGKPVLTWHIEAFNRQGIKEIGVVRGYRPEAVNLAGLHYFDNAEHASTGELFSLYQARDFLKGEVVIAYGDVIFDNFILQAVLGEDRPISIAVDAAFRMRDRKDQAPDLVETEGSLSPIGEGPGCTLVKAGAGIPAAKASGEWVGLLALRGEGTETVVRLLDRLAKEDQELLRRGSIVDLLNHLVGDGRTVNVVHTYGHWRDLDDEANLLKGEVS